MRQRSFSILELLFTLTIASIALLCVTPFLHSFIYKLYAHMTMQQIEMAINYGRSLAIRSGQQVTICPNEQDRRGQAWSGGILVSTSDGAKSWFNVFMLKHANLELRQSGFNGQCLMIEANGLTYYNGSFNYKSLKNHAFPQFKLYFNKALRIYLVIGNG